jgi:hypothetical protein
MSWQATAWAEKQKTGAPARKVLLMILANYADENGLCWPSQARLADGTEQSIDTVQRHLRKLAADGHIKIWKRARFGGRWPGHNYQLAMPSRNLRPGECPDASKNLVRPNGASKSGLVAARTGPQRESPPGRKAMRSKYPKNHHIEPSTQNSSSPHVERPQATKKTRTEIQKIESEVVSIIGNGDIEKGWNKFSDLNGWQRKALVDAHTRGVLDAAEIVRITDGGGV